MITVDFKRLNFTEGCRILDIGCGSGRHSAAACDRGRCLVIGADRGTADLTAARHRLEFHARLRRTPAGTFCPAAADVTRLPFAGQTFDLLICSEVLEHVPDDRQAVIEMARVLRAGAHLVISVPSRFSESFCWLSGAYRHAPGGHVRIYSVPDLIAKVERHGFIHRHTHHAHSLHTPYWLLKCLLGLEREQRWSVRLYHRFLTWVMFEKPRFFTSLERWLNPLLGKSIVLYFIKYPGV